MKVQDVFWLVLSAVLSLLLPKDPRLFVFGGRQYGGNTKPLFLAAPEHGLRAVWLTTRSEILERRLPGVVATRSWQGIWLGARAGAVIITHSLGDLMPAVFLSRRTRLINVWHGMPIKRISRAAPDFAQRRYAKSDLREMARFECMIATSPAMAELFATTFGLPRSRVYVTGQPRTDVLFQPVGIDLVSAYQPPLPDHSRRILYCPTWRDGEATRLFPFSDHAPERLEAFLEQQDAVMFVRTHPNDPARLSQRRGRVVPMQGDVVAEVTDALQQFDVLVTDYSSVYYDFLLLDRPAVFLPYDLEAYRQVPGFYLDFEQIVAGPCPAGFDEFLGALEAALHRPEQYAERRREVQQLVYTYLDGGASERVLKRLVVGPSE